MIGELHWIRRGTRQRVLCLVARMHGKFPKSAMVQAHTWSPRNRKWSERPRLISLARFVSRADPTNPDVEKAVQHAGDVLTELLMRAPAQP